MSSIAMIKRPGVLREEMINVIHENLTDYALLVYSEQDYELLFNKVPEMVIVDINLDINTLQLIDHFTNKNVKVITHIQYTNKVNSLLIKLFDLGLEGYFDYEMETGELIAAIKSVLNGNRYIHPNLGGILLNEYVKVKGKKIERPLGKLTDREWEVLELIVQGLENDQIGNLLFISPTTVTNHVSSILRKLDVDNRTKAASIALKNRWVSLY